MPLYLSASNLISLKSASRYIDSFHNLHHTDIQPKFYIILIAYVVRIYFVHLTKPGLVLLCLFCFRGGGLFGVFFLLYFVLFCLVLSYFTLLALLHFFSFLRASGFICFAWLCCALFCFVLQILYIDSFFLSLFELPPASIFCPDLIFFASLCFALFSFSLVRPFSFPFLSFACAVIWFNYLLCIFLFCLVLFCFA